MQNILVSIIIPIYKVEPYIVRCIDSVLQQTYRELEVILVDDCSPDHSMQMARNHIKQSHLSKNLRFVYLKHNHNRGLSAARNTGMDAATGDYIYFLDSDDSITTDCIEQLLKPLSIDTFDMVVADYDLCGSTGNYPKLILTQGAYYDRNDICLGRLKCTWYPMAWNKLYRTAFLKDNKLKFLEGVIHEDELWSSCVACVLHSMYVIQEKTYIYTIRGSSIMTDLKREERITSYVKMVAFFEHFIQQRGIYKMYETNNLLQQLFTQAVMASLKSGDYFKYATTYSQLRRTIKRHFLFFLFVNRFNVKRQIRDIHYLFPICLGARYVYRMMNIIHG